MGFKLKNAFKSFTDAVTWAPRMVAGAATAGVKAVSGGSAKEGWDQGYQQPSDTLHEGIDAASPYVNQYAPIVAGGVLTLMGHPYMGAYLNTAMQGYQGYDQTGDVNWGDVGKNAAINFGTAAVADWAKGAQSTAAERGAAQNTSFGSTGAGGGSGALQTAQARAGASLPPVNLSPANASSYARQSASMVPIAQSMQSANSGPMARFGSTAKTAATKAAPELANKALTATLAPQGATSLVGIGSEANINPQGVSEDYSNVLGAFGGNELNTANPVGPRISSQNMDEYMNRVSANRYLQYGDIRDRHVPVGQSLPTENTPYGNRIYDVEKSTNKAREQIAQQANDFNRYWSVRDTNPWITDESMQQYIDYANPAEGVSPTLPSNLPQIPQNLMSVFQGMKPMNMIAPNY